MRVWGKSLTWALIASSVTFSVAFCLTGSIEEAGILAVICRGIKFLLYPAHDWAWDRYYPDTVDEPELPGYVMYPEFNELRFPHSSMGGPVVIRRAEPSGGPRDA